jgi:hypothetical protein
VAVEANGCVNSMKTDRHIGFALPNCVFHIGLDFLAQAARLFAVAINTGKVGVTCDQITWLFSMQCFFK